MQNNKIKKAPCFRLLGIKKQAFYQHQTRLEVHQNEESLIVDFVRTIRQNHPRIGSRKLYHLFSNEANSLGLKVGRDAFITILRRNILLVRKRKTRVITTNSYHHYHCYKNLIKDIVPTQHNQIWVSDITYWQTNGKTYYIFLITDAYSKKVVGHKLATTLEAKWALLTFWGALAHLASSPTSSLIHHSDRGSQYCSKSYTQALKDNNILISMTEDSNPTDNAIAERINGIIKNEYLIEAKGIKTLEQAQEILDQTIRLYNNERPHWKLDFKTPNQVHQNNLVNVI